MTYKWFFPILLAATLSLPFMAQPSDDSERLGMAIEYFQSGKYHEALLLFEQLDKAYTLNPRYHGYMGVCYYYEWEYEEACKYLDEAMPQLEVFAPHERSVYYYVAGESHFQLKQYAAAIPYFEKALTVCFENEKGDIHYRLGMCHMFAEEWQPARDHYRAALDNYVALRNTPDMQPRIYQTSHMMKGCEAQLKKIEDMGVMGNTMAVADTLSTIDITAQEETSTTSIDSLEMVSPSIMTPISLPQITFSGNTSVPQPTTVDVASVQKQTPSSGKLVRDTIHHEVPMTINIQDLFNRQVEVPTGD